MIECCTKTPVEVKTMIVDAYINQIRIDHLVCLICRAIIKEHQLPFRHCLGVQTFDGPSDKGCLIICRHEDRDTRSPLTRSTYTHESPFHLIRHIPYQLADP